MPQRSPETAAAAADVAACRALLRGGSRTFFAASFLLPKRVREPASALYAFCRLADDAVDAADRAPDALARLHERLARAYDGRPLQHPADRAFAATVARHAIPRALPEALLEGFAWDVAGRRYADLAALEDYAARVAGTVGAMMALLMGARAPEVLARACELGVAMQLSNIARDVGEDARAGRLYLPLQWLAEAGIDADAWVARPVHSAALGHVVTRVLDEAERLYARVDAGIARLPASCRPGIHAAQLLYGEIGREVARRGADAVSQRASVSGPRKAALLLRALARCAGAPRDEAPPPLPATGFLIAAAATPAPRGALAHAPARGRASAQPAAAWNLTARINGLIDLFERLERRDQMGRSGHRT